MGQLPIKLLKTDEVAKTCILLFGERISAVGKCSNQVLKTDEVAKTCILLFGERISAVGKCSNQVERNKGLNYTFK